jgi:hypothetical protein
MVSIYLTGGLLLAFGLCFLSLPVTGNPLLHSYRKARRMMGCAYLFFAAINVVEYVFRDDAGDNILLTQMVTLSVAFSQAFLFTWSLIALLNVRWMGWWNFYRELILVLTFIVAVFGTYFACPAAYIPTVFYVLAGLYLVQLIRYVYLFRVNRRQFKWQMDNFFADGQDRWMRWVVFAFYAALTIGVLAILSALFTTPLVALLFSCVLACFYTYFAICFLCYGYRFQTIEAALDDEDYPPEISSREEINFHTYENKFPYGRKNNSTRAEIQNCSNTNSNDNK